MSAELSPPILAFLERWKETKGFGEVWSLDCDELRSIGSDESGDPFCCPLTVEHQLDEEEWPVCLPAGMSRAEGKRIVDAADAGGREPEIRRRLLEGVGLA